MRNKYLFELDLDLDVINVPGYGTLRVDRAEFKVREYLDKMIELWENGQFGELKSLLNSSVLNEIVSALDEYYKKNERGE